MPKALKLGRPSLGAQKRVRLSMTLRPELVAQLERLAVAGERSVSGLTEELLENSLKEQDFKASLWEARLGLRAGHVISLCKALGIQKLSLFGSILTDRFGPNSDVDLLVEFKPGTIETLLDKAHVLLELERAFGRRVDLAEARLLDNPIRRSEILGTARLIYAS